MEVAKNDLTHALWEDQAKQFLKGYWTTSALSLDFFFQKSWDFYTIKVFTYVVITCSILLEYFNSVTKIYNFLKMAAPVMTVESGTIHHYSI